MRRKRGRGSGGCGKAREGYLVEDTAPDGRRLNVRAHEVVSGLTRRAMSAEVAFLEIVDDIDPHQGKPSWECHRSGDFSMILET